MAVDPIETARIQTDGEKRTSCPTKRPAPGTSFADLLVDMTEKGERNRKQGIPAATAAEMLRLEMVRSAIGIVDPTGYEGILSGGQSFRSLVQYSRLSGQSTPPAGAPAPCSNPLLRGDDSSLDAVILKASRRHGVAEGLIRAVIKAESNFNRRAVSPAGAQGLMQLMPATARGLGVTDPFDPEQNIMAGTRFLGEMLNRYGGCLDFALAAYNWGPGNLDRNPGFLPRETREYLLKVKALYTNLAG